MTSRSLMPYALVRALAIIAFLAFVVMGVVPLLTPAKHLRSTDASALHDVESHNPETDTAARGIPPQSVNPHPAMGPVPPKAWQ